METSGYAGMCFGLCLGCFAAIPLLIAVEFIRYRESRLDAFGIYGIPAIVCGIPAIVFGAIGLAIWKL